MKEYNLNDKKQELKKDIHTFKKVISETTDKQKIMMYNNLINADKKELEYIKEYIAENGASIENYDYNI